MTEQNPIIPIEPTDPVNLGKWIRQELMLSTAVTAMVTDRIFPFVTADPQQLPWIVWDNLSVDFDTTKDCAEPLSASFSVFCAGATPEQSSTLASAVMAALNGNDGCRISTWTSGWNEDTQFSNELNFIIEF